MTLVVEDGTGLPTADAYISVADADEYHSYRDNAAWFDLSFAAKEGALREATAYLDGVYTWVGTLKTLSQALGWPRTGAYDHEGRLLASDEVPLRVVQATAYLALQGSSTALQPASGGGATGVKRKKVSSIEIEFFEGGGSAAKRQFSEASSLLRGLFIGGPSGISGNVVRWS